MKKILLIAVCALLVACGAGVSEPPRQMLHAAQTVKTQHVATDYGAVLQEVYVSYYGRPADPGGLSYWGDILAGANAPTDLASFIAAYNTNASVKGIIDAFGTSQESLSLYGTDNAAIVNAIYQNLFNRPAEAAGLTYWTNLLSSRTISQAQAAMTIAQGARTTDAQSVQNKVAVAIQFSTALTSPQQLSAYSGLAANSTVRTMLAGVSYGTDTTSFQSTVNSTITLLVAAPTPTPGTVAVAYSADTTGIFPNPERGFYAGSGSCSYDLPTLLNYRATQSISLVLCELDLSAFVNKNIDSTTLAGFDNAMSLVRQAGLKAIVRFGYSWATGAKPQDTTKAQMLAHIAQIKPYLQSDGDVIASMQAGFIGIWGEWYYTDYFGNDGVISPQQWQDRQDVLEALLNALPANRAVALRTPAYKQHFYGSAPLTASEAYGNALKARVGHHNDCFVSDSTDFGTYNDVTADKAYLAADALYTPQGGETCALSSYSTWNNANNDMSTLHYSYLNSEYNTDVLNSWGSNIDIARRNLGYRFTLEQGGYSQSAVAGGSIAVTFSVRNSGYAAPYNARNAVLVLRDTTSGALYKFKLLADPRTWLPAVSTVVSENVVLTGVPAGSYALLLDLADPAPALSNRPEYAIRLANAGGLWEAATGFNALKHTLVVTASPTVTTSAKVYIVGDSTVAKYEQLDYPLTGWGDRIANFFNGNISFDDEAIGGTSSKSFINDGDFAPILAQLGAGDFLFIQFGHNDCCSNNPAVKSAAQTEYKQFLRMYINGARQHGAFPVLITPMNTRNADDGVVFTYNPELAPYAMAMRELALEENVPLIDLASKSVTYLNSIGYAASANVFVVLAPGTYPNYRYARNDDVHFQDYGATQMARLVTEGIRENNLQPLTASMK
jgi:lysophospholipase L1-like esterase